MPETHAVLNVPTVSCNHCKMAIENAVGALEGVGDVAVDVAEKTVTIDFDADVVGLDAIEETVAGEGYDVAGRHVFGA
ncbi:MAG TPA: copper ion binding protein [Thermoleophilia bacterium]|nr:copper ion binding protein [Thermoleophilia bacterium]